MRTAPQQNFPGRVIDDRAPPYLEADTVTTFKPGDVVTVRAPNGPAMTILDYDDGNAGMLQPPGWRCAWFVQGAYRSETFPPEALKVFEALPAAEPPRCAKRQP